MFIALFSESSPAQHWCTGDSRAVYQRGGPCARSKNRGWGEGGESRAGGQGQSPRLRIKGVSLPPAPWPP